MAPQGPNKRIARKTTSRTDSTSDRRETEEQVTPKKTLNYASPGVVWTVSTSLSLPALTTTRCSGLAWQLLVGRLSTLVGVPVMLPRRVGSGRHGCGLGHHEPGGLRCHQRDDLLPAPGSVPPCLPWQPSLPSMRSSRT